MNQCCPTDSENLLRSRKSGTQSFSLSNPSGSGQGSAAEKGGRGYVTPLVSTGDLTLVNAAKSPQKSA